LVWKDTIKKYLDGRMERRYTKKFLRDPAQPHQGEIKQNAHALTSTGPFQLVKGRWKNGGKNLLKETNFLTKS